MRKLPNPPVLSRIAHREAHRRFALGNPCATPEDCRDWMDRYSRILRLGGYSATAQLQVHVPPLANPPLWCVSVGLLTDIGRIVALADYQMRHYGLAWSAARTVLDGLGEEGADEAEAGVTTLLVRRRCSASEVATLEKPGA